MNMTTVFGEFIKKHRMLSGYKSQRRLAEKTGISNATISRIEAGSQLPEVRTLKELSPYLHTTNFNELMKVCGYGEDEYIDNTKDKIIIDLNNNDILDQYEIKINGKSLSEKELKEIVAFTTTIRELM